MRGWQMVLGAAFKSAQGVAQRPPSGQRIKQPHRFKQVAIDGSGALGRFDKLTTGGCIADLAGEIAHQDERAFEHTDEQRAAPGVVLSDLRSEFSNALREFGEVNQNSTDAPLWNRHRLKPLQGHTNAVAEQHAIII